MAISDIILKIPIKQDFLVNRRKNQQEFSDSKGYDMFVSTHTKISCVLLSFLFRGNGLRSFFFFPFNHCLLDHEALCHSLIERDCRSPKSPNCGTRHHHWKTFYTLPFQGCYVGIFERVYVLRSVHCNAECSSRKTAVDILTAHPMSFLPLPHLQQPGWYMMLEVPIREKLTLFVCYLGKDMLLAPGCEQENKSFQELLKKASLYHSDKLWRGGLNINRETETWLQWWNSVLSP